MKISDCYNIKGITECRRIILSDTITTFGHESPQTLEIFKVSERLPEEEFDNTLIMLYCAHLRKLYEDDEIVDIDDDETGFDPYMGCYTGDC